MIKLKKIKNLNINYSFVQGRFSEEVAGRFQHFPIDNWENEFSLAKKLNFDSVEWIISDFSNPIFSPIFSKVIKNSLKKNKFKISSISLDLIMDNPLHILTNKEIAWLIKKLKFSINFFQIKRISIPIEERSRFNNHKEKLIALKNLSKFVSQLSRSCKICIETDLSPKTLINIFKIKKFKNLGILLDLGNTRAHGFNINDYFKYFSNKIISIHIKYREVSYGKTKVLKKFFFNELKLLIKNLNLLTNLQDISFQTFKTNKNYFTDIIKSIRSFNTYVE